MKYKVTITTLTPVHIGTGTELLDLYDLKQDKQQNQTYHLNVDAILEDALSGDDPQRFRFGLVDYRTKATGTWVGRDQMAWRHIPSPSHVRLVLHPGHRNSVGLDESGEASSGRRRDRGGYHLSAQSRLPQPGVFYDSRGLLFCDLYRTCGDAAKMFVLIGKRWRPEMGPYQP